MLTMKTKEKNYEQAYNFFGVAGIGIRLKHGHTNNNDENIIVRFDGTYVRQADLQNRLKRGASVKIKP
jgi:hypothetical protein